MDDPGLNDGQQDGNDPEKQDHPSFEIPVETTIVLRFEESRYGQYGSRETAYQQNDIMIAEKARLVRVMCGEKTPLVFQEFIDEPGPSFNRFIPIPGGCDQESYCQEYQRMPPGEIKFETVVNKINTEGKQENHQGHLAFCQYSQPHPNARPDDIIQLTFVDPRLIKIVSFPVIEDEIIKRKKGKKVEPGVDDPRLEIHIGKE